MAGLYWATPMDKLSLKLSHGRVPSVSRRAFLSAVGLGTVAVGAHLLASHVDAASSPLPAIAGVQAAPCGSSGSATSGTAFHAAAARGRDGLVARLNSVAGYRPRFQLDLTGDVARLVHDDYWDSVDLAGRTVDALVRLRRLLGGDPSDAELNLRDYFLGRQGELGLFYNDSAEPDGVVADSFCQGRALLGLTSWFASTGDAEVETRLQWLVDGLATIAVNEADYSYFPGRQYRSGWLDYALMAPGAYDHLDNYGYGGQCVLPLMEYYALSGYRPALDLAGRLLRHFIFHAGQVDADGHFAGETHASGYLPLATAAVRYGVTTGDESYVAWADRLYRWVRANSSEFGWVPGPLGLDESYFRIWYGTPVRRTCETNSIVDTIELAIALAGQRNPEYWDDAERFARNQLLQNQFGSAEAVLGVEACTRIDPNVRTAIAGAWESFALPYRLLARPDGQRVVEGCCSAAGSRGLGLVSEHALERRGSVLYVQTALSHSNAAADVVSYEPELGRLDVVPHAPLGLRLRVPSWAVPDTISVWVDGAQHDARREGSYLALDEVQPNSQVSLRYQLAERTEAFTVNDETTLAHWRGGTVLTGEPQQGLVPIYQLGRGISRQMF
jgi:hypothetical protein